MRGSAELARLGTGERAGNAGLAHAAKPAKYGPGEREAVPGFKDER